MSTLRPDNTILLQFWKLRRTVHSAAVSKVQHIQLQYCTYAVPLQIFPSLSTGRSLLDSMSEERTVTRLAFWTRIAPRELGCLLHDHVSLEHRRLRLQYQSGKVFAMALLGMSADLGVHNFESTSRSMGICTQHSVSISMLTRACCAQSKRLSYLLSHDPSLIMVRVILSRNPSSSRPTRGFRRETPQTKGHSREDKDDYLQDVLTHPVLRRHSYPHLDRGHPQSATYTT